MNATRNLTTILGCVAIGYGIVWSLLFPKTDELLRPDFVFSAALGAGLIGTGILCFFMTRPRTAPLVLAILFLWSVLTNLVFLAMLRSSLEVVQDIPATQAHSARYWLSIVESDREDKITYLAARLKQVIQAGAERSAAPRR